MNAVRLSLAAMFILLASVFLTAGLARAQEFRSASAVTVSKNEVIDKTVIFSSQDIAIDGTINGDVFCAGQHVDITGTINGDVICAAQDISISGTVNGSVRAAGQTITIAGKTTGNVSLVGATLVISESGIAGRDVQAAGRTFIVRGTVTRDLASSARDLTITGSVGRTAQIKADSLTISQGAHIGGNLKYDSTQAAQIPSGSVLGEIIRTTRPSQRTVNAVKVFLLGYGYWFVSFLLIAMVVLLLFPRVLANSSVKANNYPWRTILIGALAVFLPPSVITVLALTIIGIPLAVLLAMVYVVALIMSGPFVSFFVGSKFLPEQRPWVRMLLGSAVLLIVFAIPIINFIAMLAVVIFGTGMLGDVLMERFPKPAKKSA